MAVGVAIGILQKRSLSFRRIWSNFHNMHPREPDLSVMFITVACGAISGFHATQSPLMALYEIREAGHFVFYGAMVCEGVIAPYSGGCRMLPVCRYRRP